MKPSGIIGSKIPSNKIMWIFLYDTNFTYCFEFELYLCSQNSIRFSGEVISMTAKDDLLALYMNTGTNPAISLYNLTNLSFITQITVNDSPFNTHQGILQVNDVFFLTRGELGCFFLAHHITSIFQQFK